MMTTRPMRSIDRLCAVLLGSLALAACMAETPGGIHDAIAAKTTVKMDFFHKPLPEIPLPNDIATRFDASSPTLRRLNASLIAPTAFEAQTRGLFDEMDGWGVFSPIAIPFTAPIDVNSIRDRHCIFAADDLAKTHCAMDTDQSDDAVYVINVSPQSDEFGRVHHLDIGHGNFPLVVEDIDGYWPFDPRGDTVTLLFDEHEEDVNGNGVLDDGEDTDLDGVLDTPNYLPGHDPAADDLRGRADAVMTFYERETNTLIVRPLTPLRERTTYAVVVTRRVLDEAGEPVGSPYPWVNHSAQTQALMPLLDVLPAGTAPNDIAYTFSFTTQSIESTWQVVRDGLYGHGIQKQLGAQFPAELSGLHPIREGEDNPYILYSEEWATAMALLNQGLLGGDGSSLEGQMLTESQKYIDYHVIGTFAAPQLFEREDEEGNTLGLNQQSWPSTLFTKPATARSEDITFWLTIPRKEVSARGEGKQVPVVVLGHGYGSSRFEALQFGGFFAKHGIAVLAIDAVSHGISISPEDEQQALEIMELFGLKPFMDAVLTDRAIDQDGDGLVDSGVDYWSAYLFHTRDVVRQSILDHMQLLRILKTFDGTRRWHMDLDGDGTNELAGDFDGDGVVDVGAESVLGVMGGSLGGILSTVMGGVEPHVQVVAPIAGGGGLGDIGLRSMQGGVREAVILRMMGPLYGGRVSFPAADAGGDPGLGTLTVQTIVPDTNNDAMPVIGTIEGVALGDTFLAINHANGEVACGLIAPSGTVRVSLQSDVADGTTLQVYRGLAVERGDKPNGEVNPCVLGEDAELVGELTEFGVDVVFQDKTFAAGTPLEALAEGMGRARATPGLRRLMMLGQIVLDGADPATHAEFMLKRPFTYPGTGETTGAHAMVITTMGDMNVPASSGGSIGRAAGLIDYINEDPRYGKTPNQMLIDTGTYEAVHTISRYFMPNGQPTHIDIENFAGDKPDPWGADVPRMDPPARLIGPDSLCDGPDGACGLSGAIFPFPQPTGQHGFSFPGGLVDTSRRRCQAACGDGNDCGCEAPDYFDIGNYMFNIMARYLGTGGHELNLDSCNNDYSCDYKKSVPSTRDSRELRP